MPHRAVVLSFDRLHLGYLGCYGNDWIETPGLDRLATQAVVFDRHFAESVDANAANHAWWTGRYQCLLGHEAQRAGPSFLERLPAGTKSWLLVESDGGDSHFVAPPFDEVVSVRGLDGLDADDDQPPFARLVETAVARLPEVAAHGGPTLLWLKSRGVPSPWLPPRPFADLYLDEFGLGAASGNEEEDSEAGSDAEAVVETRYARAMYASYVSWLDRWTGKLLRSLEQQPEWAETMFVVAAAAGQSLGERGAISEANPLLREEVIHTPLLVRLADRAHDATRRNALVQTVDLAPTVVEWLSAAEGRTQGTHSEALVANREEASPFSRDSIEERGAVPLRGHSLLPLVRNERDALRDRAIIGTPDEWGLRDDDFLCVERRAAAALDDERPRVLLFEKPHDRWDQSDVSSQFLPTVERMTIERRRITDGLS